MSRLLALTPLRLEQAAAALGAPGATVLRTGAGPARAAAALPPRAPEGTAAVAVLGVAGALVDDLPPGTLVVADRVLDMVGTRPPRELPSAGLLAAALRQAGLAVRVGAVVTTPRLVRGPARAELAASGAIAVDMESSELLGRDLGLPTAVVRAVVDTPGQELVSSATFAGGLKALSALRKAAPVLEHWASVAGPRRVLLAGPRSFCAGVERAIATVEAALALRGAPVYVRRQIVHNRHVVSGLESRGAVFVQELEEVPDGATVVFSAHGVAPAVREEARRRGLEVIDATCPLVAKVHHEVRRFSDRGHQVVLIGHAGHDETEGTLGEAPGIALLERPEDVEQLEVVNPERLAYINQTTLSPEDVAGVVEALRRRFPAVVGPHASDICYATQNRQDALKSIAPECDLVLVVGSRNSSNTQRLVEVASRAGSRAEILDDASELRLEWLEGASTIGLTAGASAPEELVAGVVAALAGAGSLEVEERRLRNETVSFPLPPEVREP